MKHKMYCKRNKYFLSYLKEEIELNRKIIFALCIGMYVKMLVFETIKQIILGIEEFPRHDFRKISFYPIV